ncbi:ATP-binding protein [Streptomyces sp. NPDC051217]|uniref:ATP-binding protein n=1 Tax=Streptomyces sp. NPDC051217 TaxID=3365644 RepID=UPI0037874353
MEHPGGSANDLSGSSRDVVQAGSVSGGIHFHGPGSEEDRPSAGPRPRQLPADVPGFVNRVQELDQLNAVVAGENSDPLVISVCVIAGTAGAGKTSLALRWAHQARDRFPDGQLYVNLRGYDPGEPVTAEEALHRFLPALGVPAQSVPQNIDAAAALYRSLLSDRRMLVLLDNASTAGQVRPLLPGGPGCLVLVTSRSRLSGLAVRDGARRLTLGTLPQAEAVALLRAVTAGYRPEDDLEKLTELADLCARLPLALRIAAERAASRPHLRLDDLIADLRDESALWDALSTGDDEEAEAVRTVFAWSYRALSEQAARLFRLLGMHPGPEFGLQAAAAIAAAPVSGTRHLLDSLVNAHLLEQMGPDRYQFHDLLRAYATDQAHHEEPAGERDAALHRVLDWYLHGADAAQDWISPDEQHMPLAPPGNEVRPSAFADYNSAVDWAEREHANLLRAIRAAAGTDDRRAWQLAVVFFNARPSSAPVNEWLAVGDIALEAARRAGDRQAEARLLTHLGRDNVRVDRLSKALECHRSALEIRHETGDHVGEATSLNLIGLVHLRRRELTAAAQHFQRAIPLFQEVDSPPWAAIALSNLASAHYSAGRLSQSSAVARDALAAHRAMNNFRGEGNILRVMSCLQLEEGRPEEALASSRQALDIAETLRDNRLEGYWLIALGDAQRALGTYDDALVSYQRSAALHRRLGNRSREALAWYGAGQTYHALERCPEAAQFHRRAVAAHRELGDGWHEALALDGLAGALVEDDPEGAAGHWGAAWELVRGYDDPRAVAMRERVAAALGRA